MTVKQFEVLEDMQDVKQFFEGNALSYGIVKQFIVNSRYGLQLVRLEIEYSSQEGDRKLWVNANTWEDNELELLLDYFEEVFFA